MSSGKIHASSVLHALVTCMIENRIDQKQTMRVSFTHQLLVDDSKIHMRSPY